MHLIRYDEEKYGVALIYPGEYEDEVSAWLSAQAFRTTGAAEGGPGAVERYYQESPEILDRHQLFGRCEGISRTGDELLGSLKQAVQR